MSIVDRVVCALGGGHWIYKEPTYDPKDRLVGIRYFCTQCGAAALLPKEQHLRKKFDDGSLQEWFEQHCG